MLYWRGTRAGGRQKRRGCEQGGGRVGGVMRELRAGRVMGMGRVTRELRVGRVMGMGSVMGVAGMGRVLLAPRAWGWGRPSGTRQHR